MTKTLTEQWRDGTLPKGWYYVKTHCEEIKKLYCGDGESLELDDPETSAYYFYHRENGKSQVEVLAPVPSYDEFQSYEKCADMLIDVNKKWEKTIKERKQLVSKTEQLEKKLEIATEALKEVVVASDNYRFCQSVGYKNLAEEALKEMEGVK